MSALAPVLAPHLRWLSLAYTHVEEFFIMMLVVPINFNDVDVPADDFSDGSVPHPPQVLSRWEMLTSYAAFTMFCLCRSRSAGVWAEREFTRTCDVARSRLSARSLSPGLQHRGCSTCASLARGQALSAWAAWRRCCRVWRAWTWPTCRACPPMASPTVVDIVTETTCKCPCYPSDLLSLRFSHCLWASSGL